MKKGIISKVLVIPSSSSHARGMGGGGRTENQVVRVSNFHNPCEKSCENRLTCENALRNFVV